MTGIWVNPIFRAHCYHNYFADDFDSTDPGFGTMAQFTHLVKALHARGMKIFIDMETQYISSYHIWFANSIDNPASPYGNYIWYYGPDNTSPEEGMLVSYDGTTEGIVTLKLNTQIMLLNQEIIYNLWCDPNNDSLFDDGVDGFRIDHIMDNLDYNNENTNLFHTFWSPIVDAVHTLNPNVFFLGEQADWGDYGSSTLRNSGIDAVFGIPQMFAIRSFNKANILSAAQQTQNATDPGKHQFTIIENHDVDRFASIAGGSAAKMKIGAALDLTLNGVPCLYYGQELGMKGNKGNWGSDGNDIPNREAFRWYSTVAGSGMALWYANTGPWWNSSKSHDHDGVSLEEEKADSNSLWWYYKKLIALRKNESLLRRGSYTVLSNPNDLVLSYARQESTYAGAVSVIINLGTTAQQASINCTPISNPAMHASYSVNDLMGNRQFVPVTASNVSAYPVSLAAGEVLVLRIHPQNVSYTHAAAWNLLSLAKSGFTSGRNVVFPGASSRAFTFRNGMYAAEDSIVAGRGYWVKFDSAGGCLVPGNDLTADTISLTKGWNLVGSVAGRVAVSQLITSGANIIPPIFNYQGEYFLTDTLEAWKGYWINMDGAGTLIIKK